MRPAAFGFVVAFGLLPWLSGAALGAPALVVLIRHGHKDRPVPQQPDNFNLSPQGLQQAVQLGRLLPRCLNLSPADLALVSHGFDLQSGKNARSYQTLVPLAVASGRNIRVVAEAAESSESVGRALLEDPRYDRQTVVIAWEHRRLPLLAKGLGWSQMPPVDDDDFDSLWLLRFGPGEGPPRVRRLSQAGLLGPDCRRPI